MVTWGLFLGYKDGSTLCRSGNGMHHFHRMGDRNPSIIPTDAQNTCDKMRDENEQAPCRQREVEDKVLKPKRAWWVGETRVHRG